MNAQLFNDPMISSVDGSVTKRLLCIPVRSTYQCKTRGKERWHCPPRGEADEHNSQSIPWQDALPYAFEAGLDSNLFVTLPVTCGGLCPGINNAIRAIVLTLHYAYGVPRILGFRYGYAGLTSQSGSEPFLLSPATVDTIHEDGGTLLGTSRGQRDIGGDGTMRGARALHQEIVHRGLRIGIIGIPKTIDNDLAWIERSFGFNTAVAEARRVVAGAHAEARGAWNSIGLVKLMGRYAGFIAAHASLASSDVNFCLVPEVPLMLDGECGFFRALERRLDEKRHAVIVVAEGAGQELLQDPTHQEYDSSGNLRLKDIGGFLRDQITHYFTARHKEITIKYIDPSYTIRSLPADSLDAESCLMLGQYAVHAGMAGCTDMLVSYWNQHFVHVPLGCVTHVSPQLDMQGEIWQSVLEATGQPALWAGGDGAGSETQRDQ
jgi:6-phosphofructokinase 1